ncbi:hypothetical protein K466DRAFT_341359 [Polyporus arcularius HHB13444]|uniref:Uncharacterized protein n=1 Tax=Polyporus arcularius HHB13444 TaxID=1314778 RepID=A0A5C3PS26_9APHY|nr:hypothetical protein K466DRAFT_341359 [Polyporus arcularius HHB13444]
MYCNEEGMISPPRTRTPRRTYEQLDGCVRGGKYYTGTVIGYLLLLTLCDTICLNQMAVCTSTSKDVGSETRRTLPDQRRRPGVDRARNGT